MPYPFLPTGVHHIGEIMPQVLARDSLSPEQVPTSAQPTPATDPTNLFHTMITTLESALAS